MGDIHPVADLAIRILGGTGALIDVGAHIGMVSIPVAASGSDVVAVELLPENCLKLQQAIAASRLTRVHVVQGAATDADGIVHFAGDDAWGIVVKDGPRATGLKLDTIARLFDLPDHLLIKIDVEGHELEVLHGAAELLRRRPYVIFESIENAVADTTRQKEVKRYVEAAGYRLFLIRNHILVPRTAADLQEPLVADYLAVPAEKANLMVFDGLEARGLSFGERHEWLVEMVALGGVHRDHARVILAELGTPEFRRAAG